MELESVALTMNFTTDEANKIIREYKAISIIPYRCFYFIQSNFTAIFFLEQKFFDNDVLLPLLDL